MATREVADCHPPANEPGWISGWHDAGHACPVANIRVGWRREARTAPVVASATANDFLEHLRETRVELFLHQQGLDTTTSSGRAMFGML